MVRVETYDGSGTGFVFESGLDGSAYVLTNHHVIDGASSVDVRINESQTYNATVIGYDAYMDVAVLRICCGSFQVLSLGGSEPIKAGTEVIAIGYPLGIVGSATVTKGIVSAFRYDDEYRSWVVQTDAPINPGNSGGPLLLSNGDVIGINTFIIREDYGLPIDGVGFAISKQSFQGILDGLKSGTRVDFPTPIPTPTQVATTIPGNWQTYDNRSFGYSVQVPSDWSIDDREKDYVYFTSQDEFAEAVIFIPDYRIWSSEDRLEEFVEGLKPDYHFLEVLDRDSTTFDGGGEVAYIQYRSQYSPILCIEVFEEWLWVYGSTSYWLSLSVCEHSFEEHDPVLYSIWDSLVFR